MKIKIAFLLLLILLSGLYFSCSKNRESQSGSPASSAERSGPNAKDAGGITPLMSAARDGDASRIRELLSQGADLNVADSAANGWNALMHAIHKNRGEAALALIDAGINVNARTEHGTTALIMAAGNGDAVIVEALLSKGADPYVEGGAGVTALSMAVSGGALSDIDRPLLGGCYEPVVKLLLAKAPDLTLKNNFAGRSALWFARLKSCDEVVSLIKNQERKLAARAK